MRIFRAILLICLLVVTAAPSDGADLSRQVLAEINLARTDPLVYVNFLREFRRTFRGKSYQLPGSQALVRTTEGVKAVDEAIRFLSRQKPFPPLTWSTGLSAAADDLVTEEGASGAIGHVGKAGEGPQRRIERHGRWQRAIGEDISYGPDEARQVVMELIIDDGVPDRGHRKNIFSRAFSMAGVACGSHPGFGQMCVIDFAGGFGE